MGQRFNRRKKRHWLLSIAYKINKILWLPSKTKVNLYLNLEWIFNRLSHEMSFSQYNALEHPFRQQTMNFLSKHINASNSILDLGCKYGEISFLLSKLAKYVVGIDYDQIAIERAKKSYRCDVLEFYHAEAHEFLKKSSKKFDILILSHVLEHLDEPGKFINRFKGFFKSIYIEVPDFEATYLNQYRLRIGNELLYTDIDHISEFDRDEITSLINESGLEIIDSELRFGVQRFFCKVS